MEVIVILYAAGGRPDTTESMEAHSSQKWHGEGRIQMLLEGGKMSMTLATKVGIWLSRGEYGAPL